MTDRIENALKAAVDSGDTAGANVLILKNSKEIAYTQCGYRDIENKIAMSRDTIFRLYSQTKPITAAAVMLLVSMGKIDLGAWLSDYMPEFSDMYVNRNGVRTKVKNPITVQHLMNMTSGLAYPDDLTEGGKQSGGVFWQINERLYSNNPVTTDEFAKMMANTDLCFEPGEHFMYGSSADILGALVARVSGLSFREFLIENLFEPLEMNDTDFYVPQDKANRLAKAYDYSDKGLVEIKTDHLGLRYNRDVIPAFESGGAGLCATLDDYAKFADMLLNNGRYKGMQIMPEQAVRYMTHGGLTDAQKPELWNGWSWMRGYTYGSLMRVCDNESQTTLFSSEGEYGWDGWLGTFFSNEPKHKITLLFGTQQAGIGKTGTLVRKIKNIVMSELA
ncbi:MAG: beta-lactamase family protein [Ruminococcus sp.]|nr:beta-lactamase family protein [Ruminococcus sp.]